MPPESYRPFIGTDLPSQIVAGKVNAVLQDPLAQTGFEAAVKEVPSTPELEYLISEANRCTSEIVAAYGGKPSTFPRNRILVVEDGEKTLMEDLLANVALAKHLDQVVVINGQPPFHTTEFTAVLTHELLHMKGIHQVSLVGEQVRLVGVGNSHHHFTPDGKKVTHQSGEWLEEAVVSELTPRALLRYGSPELLDQLNEPFLQVANSRATERTAFRLLAQHICQRHPKQFPATGSVLHEAARRAFTGASALFDNLDSYINPELASLVHLETAVDDHSWERYEEQLDLLLQTLRRAGQ